MGHVARECCGVQLTFIVVQKRHHTRMFPQGLADADRSGNIPPGTVLDRRIVHPTGFTFFLNSHAGLQGTNCPAHYAVLLDENGCGAASPFPLMATNEVKSPLLQCMHMIYVLALVAAAGSVPTTCRALPTTRRLRLPGGLAAPFLVPTLPQGSAVLQRQVAYCLLLFVQMHA